MESLVKKFKIEEGGYISKEELEKTLDMEVDAFVLMQLREQLIRENEDLKVVISKEGLRFLNNPEASQYYARRFGNQLSGLCRTQFMMLRVDRKQLKKLEREIHDGRVEKMGKIIGMIKGEFTKELNKPSTHYQRKLPKLFQI